MGALLLVSAGFLVWYPFEGIREELSQFKLSEVEASAILGYKEIAGIGLGILIMFVLLARVAQLKSTYYEVTSDRIEWARGIFSRRIDNLDLFRVVDLRLQRSLWDCIVGIGMVALVTTDKTDPEFSFMKLKGARKLYDILKITCLDADQKRGVIHLE